MTPPELEASDLAELSIFPLPQVTLFPGAVLPLHVFEPRYRDLVREALKGRMPPVLAPGMMIHLGLLGLAWTWKHPAAIKVAQNTQSGG